MSVQKISQSRLADDQPNKDILELLVDEIQAIRKSLGSSDGAAAGILVGSATWDLSAGLANGANASKDVTVTGAALGDFCLPSISIDGEQCTITANVRAANTVEVQIENASGGTATLASCTVRVLVIPKAAIALAAMVLSKS